MAEWVPSDLRPWLQWLDDEARERFPGDWGTTHRNTNLGLKAGVATKAEPEATATKIEGLLPGERGTETDIVTETATAIQRETDRRLRLAEEGRLFDSDDWPFVDPREKQRRNKERLRMRAFDAVRQSLYSGAVKTFIQHVDGHCEPIEAPFWGTVAASGVATSGKKGGSLVFVKVEPAHSEVDSSELTALGITTNSPKRKGRPREFDWDLFHAAIIMRWYDNDGVSEKSTDDEKWGLEWFEDRFGKSPQESAMREHVSAARERFEKLRSSKSGKEKPFRNRHL